jgi:hypothetical protein
MPRVTSSLSLYWYGVIPMETVFTQELTTGGGTTIIKMKEQTDDEGKSTIFLHNIMKMGTLRVRIDVSDANDILVALTRVNQLMTKAVALGEVE